MSNFFHALKKILSAHRLWSNYSCDFCIGLDTSFSVMPNMTHFCVHWSVHGKNKLHGSKVHIKSFPLIYIYHWGCVHLYMRAHNLKKKKKNWFSHTPITALGQNHGTFPLSWEDNTTRLEQVFRPGLHSIIQFIIIARSRPKYFMFHWLSLWVTSFSSFFFSSSYPSLYFNCSFYYTFLFFPIVFFSKYLSFSCFLHFLHIHYFLPLLKFVSSIDLSGMSDDIVK